MVVISPLVRPNWRAADLDLEVICDRYLGAPGELEVLQSLLVARR